jgi:hypothetical protein
MLYCEYFKKNIEACTIEFLPITKSWTWETANAPVSCKKCAEFAKHRQKENVGKIIVRKRS